MQCAAKLLRVVGKRDKERSRAKKAVICGFIDTAPFAAVFCNKPLCLNVISQMLPPLTPDNTAILLSAIAEILYSYICDIREYFVSLFLFTKLFKAYRLKEFKRN